MKRIWLLLFFIVQSFSAEAATLKITDIHVTNLKSAARITFGLSTVSAPHVFTLSHPDRIVVDFKDAQLAVNLKRTHFSNVIIAGVRQGRPARNVLRLVFDVRMPVHFVVKPAGHSSPLTIELSPLHSPKSISALHWTPIVPVHKKILTVVIDPGHGGNDPGAVGVLGMTEKTVVLAIAQQLADLINHQPAMRAILTRRDDYYVSLHNRLVAARKGKADLFIAIHADSYFNNHAAGASVYALSEYGATSIAARWLAKRENYSELNRIDLRELTDQSYILRSVLIDLAQTVTVRDSLRLGNNLLNALQAVTRLHYARVEQAPFMVLKSPDIPSILVETGFISNPKEELRLRDKKYQHKIAMALLNGIRAYQQNYVG